ncbi:hypothetical protein FITA111629_09860 [Filibacter tadaridae]|uniref:Addiction module component n=1 Tax=Filibacter tadaridae TaxID=2483811 RepID=A0A3P5XNY5_9BACL|nr:hypothetical protein [Filibacter tadaridae]VDC32071.1 hypothetical protein FILTAD_02573 [Filibacter tadaridae]
MMDRNDLHRLVDELPEGKLPRLSELFRHMFDEEELELNEEAKGELAEARERVKSGEYITLNELLKDSQDV